VPRHQASDHDDRDRWLDIENAQFLLDLIGYAP
jgi:hypothetical protein